MKRRNVMVGIAGLLAVPFAGKAMAKAVEPVGQEGAVFSNTAADSGSAWTSYNSFATSYSRKKFECTFLSEGELPEGIEEGVKYYAIQQTPISDQANGREK